MEEGIFDEQTTAKIDAKLHHDILNHEDNIFKFIIVLFFVLLFIFRGWIGYWFKFGVAIPSKYVQTPINVMEEPFQKNYNTEEQRQKTFIYTSFMNKYKIKMIPQAHYELSGQVVAYNHPVLFLNGFYEDAALYDFGAVWGKLADKEFYNKYLQCNTNKTMMIGSRIMYLRYKYSIPLSEKYIISHFSHTHVVPATRNVMAAMLKLKSWDKFKLEGELVDMEYTNSKNNTISYKTSLSRKDTYDSGRGFGPSETVYVTGIQIGNRIYK